MIYWLLPTLGAVLFCLIIGFVFQHIYRKGLIWEGNAINPRWVHEQEKEHILEGQVVEPEAPFFDEHDVAAMEQHLEDPHFHGTVVEINGIRVGKDGMPVQPDPDEKGWFRR